MNPLPPQAYTKETLGKAFAWLQSQSENIKEMATSPDVLVSLFLKAKLNGNGALDRPSIQNFKNELKSLAGMMGEFEVTDHPQPTITSRPPPVAAEVQATSPFPDLDSKSLGLIQEVKTEFNLSSDCEALRLLISLGCKALKKL
jgi:hypothetical protein